MLRHLQRGAVLATSLIVLVVMTLLVLGMLKTSVLELKIGGMVHSAEQNFSNAEVGLAKYINDNNGRFSDGCLSAAGTSNCFCTNPDAEACQNAMANTTYDAASKALIIGEASFFGAQQTQLTANQLSTCTPDAGWGSGNQITRAGASAGLGAVFFDVAAKATGAVSGQASVHQGIKTFCMQSQ